jgi:8-oxo-dGTP pyrophosphatase MutT (NUDIX family)/ribosomal protein S18 acetylase RimI-like enzyme
MIVYRKAVTSDIVPALELALRVFMEYEAPGYPPEGAEYYRSAINAGINAPEKYMASNRMIFVALDNQIPDNEKIVGVIVSRNDSSAAHISMLFVEVAYHRRGIGTELTNRVVCEFKLRGFEKITLGASPFALPFYLKYGFKATGSEELRNGIISTPMEYTPNEIWDVLDKDGNKTGRYHERGRAMAAGDYHLCVHVWKHNAKGQWLIDKRVKKSPDDMSGGKWETTGGAAVAGDDSLTAALRETKEELGLELDPAKGLLFRRFAREGFYGHTYLMDVWVFEYDCAIEDVRYQERETCDAMWATAEQIRQLIKNNEFFSDVELYFDEMVHYVKPTNNT